MERHEGPGKTPPKRRRLGIAFFPLLLALAALSPACGRSEDVPASSPTGRGPPAPDRAEPDTSGWYVGALPHDGSPVDLSGLNETPAGTHGFLRSQGDRFVFEDGTPIRFFGANVAGAAIFSEKAWIEVHARRIAALGMNLVRFHHHDSSSFVPRPVIDGTRADTRRLDPEVMDRLHYWIRCLKEQGVYVWLDLHVGRRMKEGDELGAGWPEIEAGGGEVKGFCYFNEVVTDRMKELNRAYIETVNPYTGLSMVEDPAIVAVQITNENDLTSHFGNRMLADRSNPWHRRRFLAAAREFSARHGFDAERTGETWLPGPGKLFLADREAAWNRSMIEHLRSLGARMPVSTTSMWGNPGLFGLPPLTVGDFVDAHAYGRPGPLARDPRHEVGLPAEIAFAAAEGFPVTVSEWNFPWPQSDRFTGPLHLASIAALQGWDALLLYNYTQRRLGPPERQGTWSTFADPALIGLLPAAALLYRREDVRLAERHFLLTPGPRDFYFRDLRPSRMATLRTLAETSRVTIALPDLPEFDWDRASSPAPAATVLDELDRDFLPPGSRRVRSDTGELTRDFVAGYQIIDTPRTQAVHGSVGGAVLVTRSVRFEIETPVAAVALSALDDRPIDASRRILLTVMARVTGTDGDRHPLRSEPVTGTLRVRAPSGLALVPLSGSGGRRSANSVAHEEGEYVLRLPVPGGTHWFLLTGE